MNYSDTQISDAWNVLFQASDELKSLIRRQPAQVIDFQREKEKRENFRQTRASFAK